MASSERKVWLITGCSSGFGLCITKHALQKGDRVIATLRKPEVLSDLAKKYPDILLVLELDVTKLEEVTAAFAAGQKRFGRIDVVVNNAGFLIVGEVEGTPEDLARSLFEVNFWGASRVSREAVRYFREENQPIGGRLLQISSSSGIRSYAGMAYYAATKFALEALSEGLAAELHPGWNIKVTIVEPGPFRTKCPTDNATVSPVHPAYAEPSSRTVQLRTMMMNSDPVFNGDPDKFADAVYRAAYLEDPPLRLPINSVASMREKGKHLLDTADKWESWSEDMSIKD